MIEDQNNIISELKKHFISLYGSRLFYMILYGSQARGDAEAGSDIDILVVLAGDTNPFSEISRTEFIVSELSLKYNVVIACVFTSRERFENYRSPLFLNIHREGVVI